MNMGGVRSSILSAASTQPPGPLLLSLDLPLQVFDCLGPILWQDRRLRARLLQLFDFLSGICLVD